MFKLKTLVVLLFTLGLVASFKTEEYEKFIIDLAKNEEYNNDFENNVKELLELEPNYFDYSPIEANKVKFQCDTKYLTNRTAATTVNQLTPYDIKVVAALGDSLTAALGSNARTIVGLLIEFRGRSWSVGGDKKLERLVTLPNILKKFNPKLRVYSTGLDLSLASKTGVGLNVAVSGQESNHIPDQARTLVKRLKSDKNVDFQNDWKLITLFIGGNDLCGYCHNKTLHSPDSYTNFIKEGLDIIYKEVPRAFVNLVSVLNVKEVKLLNRGLVCSSLHKWVCDCAAFPKTPADEEELKEYHAKYIEYTRNLISSGRYNERDDFTVVVQPFFEEFDLPRNKNGKIDFSFFAPDCFHLSTKGHGNNNNLYKLTFFLFLYNFFKILNHSCGCNWSMEQSSSINI